MTRTEIKKKIKECLQKFDGVDSPDDMVSETLFTIYREEMNELCRMFEAEFRKLHQPTVSNSSLICERCQGAKVVLIGSQDTRPCPYCH